MTERPDLAALLADPAHVAEWTADLRAALERLTAEHRARVDTLLAPFTVASFTGETPTAAELAARDREEAARARERSKGKPPRRATDPDPTNTTLPPLDALNAIEDDRVPAAMAHFAALQVALAARLAEVSARKPRWQKVAWAAEQSGLSEHFFYERANPDHPDPLPFVRKRGRAVRVEEAGFRRWFKSR